MQFFILLITAVYLCASGAYGLVPAVPTNDTKALSIAYDSKSNGSTLLSQWFTDGVFRTGISYALAGSNHPSLGVSTGVLVNFSDDDFNQTGTTVPWVALISCDSGPTSSADDIFTLAHSKGAISAVLYSVFSAGCLLNSAYTDLAISSHPIDVFALQGASSARLVESLFSHLPIPGQVDSTNLTNYDASQLNNTANDIEESIKIGRVVSSGYIITTVQVPTSYTPGPVWTNATNATITTVVDADSSSTSVFESPQSTSLNSGSTSTRRKAWLCIGITAGIGLVTHAL